MAVKIRLKRMGAKKAPFYRIVVADSRSPRDGRFIEEIGYYNPMEEPKVVKVDADKAKDWISKGAQPTDTVKNSIQKTWCSVIIGRITHEGIIVNSCKRSGRISRPSNRGSR